MYKRATVGSNASGSLPPLSPEDGSNILQRKPEPASYLQNVTAAQSRHDERKAIAVENTISQQPESRRGNCNGLVMPTLQSLETVAPASPAVPVPPPPPPPPPEAVVADKLSIQAANASSQVTEGNVSQLLIPKPPPVPRIHSGRSDHSNDSNVTTSKPAELPALQERMTVDYVRNWTLVNDEFERGMEEVEYAIETLQKNQPTLITLSSQFTLLFMLLNFALTRKNKCSPSNRERIVKLLLQKGWITFITDYFQLLFNTENWDGKDFALAIDNLAKALTIMRHLVPHAKSEICRQVVDEYFNVVYNHLNHPAIIEVARGPTIAPAFKIMRSLLNMICDFIVTSALVKTKLTAEQRNNAKLLMTKYTELLREGTHDLTTCYRALNFLDEDECSIPRLPLAHMTAVKEAKEVSKEHADDIVHMVKRLASISTETHSAKPLRYQDEFSFLEALNFPPNSKKAGQPTENWGWLYGAFVKDGTLYNLAMDLHRAALAQLDGKNEGNTLVNAFLTNVRHAFAPLVNGTDYCKHPPLLQETFDNTFEYMYDHLNDPATLVAMEKGSVVGEIAADMITALHNFSYYHEPTVPIMREKGVIPLMRRIRQGQIESEVKTDCLLVIAFLMNEGDDKKLMSITGKELDFLMDELKSSMLVNSESSYHPEELIDGLIRIAVRDINKLKLIECGALKLLGKSLNPTNKYSVEHRAAAAKAIWSLAFSEESRREIKEEKGLMTSLKSLKDSEDKELRLAVAGALWQLEGKEKHIEDLSKTSSVKEVEQKHIMLSYNHQAKAEVFKMRDVLKGEGYTVWIDVEQITAGASTLEAMSKAIEDSCIVLIFFSESYKNSINCRAEAEYVFERRKLFLPVQVQAGYTPEGWLGILFGSKYRYTLSKPDRYDSEVSGLLGKVRELTTGQLEPQVTDEPDGHISAAQMSSAATVPHPLSAMVQRSVKCKSWSQQQVSDWFRDNGFEQLAVKASLTKIDGHMLAELVTLSCSHKDAFYNLLCNKTPDVDLGTILWFSSVVQQLAID